MFGRIPLWSHLVVDFHLLKVGFLITNSIALIVISLFKLFILDSVLTAVFPEICPFLLGCPICWHITVHSIFLWLHLCSVSCYFFLFNFLFFFILVLSLFFLVNLAKGLSILSFQNTTCWFHWSFLLFLYSLFFYFLSDHYYFLPSADFRICSFFFS